MFDTIRELAYGIKVGVRHSVDTRHNMTEKAMRPSVTAALRNMPVATEHAGR